MRHLCLVPAFDAKIHDDQQMGHSQTDIDGSEAAPSLPPARRLSSLWLIPAVLISSIYFSYPFITQHTRLLPKAQDAHYGIRLTPSNYTVITGIFIQGEPDFNATGYDPLGDDFGLIDKSPQRWTDFSTFVHL
jgi:hypothetical protein